jgi:hypothetical protein
MTGVERITVERERQVREEGWTRDHDDRYEAEELARAALCYAMPPRLRNEVPLRLALFGEGWETCAVHEAEVYVPEHWPFSPTDWKPSGGSSTADRIRELTKAGGLIAAEIDRLERRHR